MLLTLPLEVFAILLRRPPVWVWLAASALVWPAILAFAPLGLTTGDRPGAAAYDVAFMGLLLGHGAGLALLARSDWLLGPLSPARRWAARAVALTTAAILFTAAGLLPVVLLGPRPGSEFALGLLGCHLHVGALALCLAALPLRPALRLGLLPALVWLLPALLSAPGSFLDHAFGAARHLDGFAFGGDGTVWNGLIAPMVGLGVAAWLLDRAAPLAHALRGTR